MEKMHEYSEYVIEVLENSGVLDNGKAWSNYTIVTCIHRDGIPWKIETYKGSPSHIDKVFNLSSVSDIRMNTVGHKVLSYSFDKYSKLNSFVYSDDCNSFT